MRETDVQTMVVAVRWGRSAAERVAEAREQDLKRGALVAGASKKGASRLRERASAGRTFESIGDEWIAGVGIGRRKGRGKSCTNPRRGTTRGAH